MKLDLECRKFSRIAEINQTQKCDARLKNFKTSNLLSLTVRGSGSGYFLIKFETKSTICKSVNFVPILFLNRYS